MSDTFRPTKRIFIKTMLLFILGVVYSVLPYLVNGKLAFEFMFSIPFWWMVYSLNPDTTLAIIRLVVFYLLPWIFIILTPLLYRFKWPLIVSIIILGLDFLFNCLLSVNILYSVLSHFSVLAVLLFIKIKK